MDWSPDPTRRSVLGAAALLPASLAGCVSVPGSRETEERSDSYDAPDGTRLSVTNANGDVAVEPVDGDAVTVEATLSTRFGTDLFDQVEVAAERSGDALRLVVRRTGDEETFPRVRVDLAVGVPAGATLAEARTANGDATATGVTGDAELRTENGDAEAHDVDGFVTLRSTNGDVTARGVAGLRYVETVNGEADVEVPAIRDDVTVGSVNGDVEAALGDLDAAVTARTRNGDVQVEDLDLVDATTSRNEVRGRLGEGRYDLAIRTENGDVTLTALE